MVEITKVDQEVRYERSFKRLDADEDQKELKITYREKTFVDNVLVNEVNKSYIRPYQTWKASSLGGAILDMVNLDLGFNDVQTKDGQLDQEGEPVPVEE